MDFTGCGNTLNMQHPRVLALLMDSLRYWVTEMHVDGFRFGPRVLRSRASCSTWIASARSSTPSARTPVLSQVKLIAEPWGRGHGRIPGRQLPAGLERMETIATATPLRAYWKGERKPHR
jgi:glycogen operon protein